MLPALLTVVAAMALGVSPVWDYDVWFHLACGRDLVAARGIPPYDTLSFTAFDRPWDAHEWLFDAALFGLWTVGGLPLLVAVKALLAGALGWLIYRRSAGATPDPAARWIAAGFTVGGIWLCRWSIVERPQLVSFVFVAFELLWLDAGRSPWALVPLEGLWANLHGGSALLGPGVFGLHLAGRTLDAWRTGRPWRDAMAGWPVGLAMVAAIAATPSGLRLFAYPFETLRDTMYRSNILEWMPPTRHEHPGFFIWIAVTGVLAGIAVRRTAWSDLAVALPLAVLPWTARRHIPLACLALTPLAARSAALLLARLPAPRGFAPACAVILSAGLVVGAARHGEALRPGVRDDLFPAAAIPVLRAARPHLAPGRPLKVWTLHRWGGFAAWHLAPEFKTFIDGRQLVFPPGLFTDYYRILEDLPEAGALVDRWSPDLFVLNYGTRLSRRLAADPRFALVHWDDATVVYARRSIAAPAWLARTAYRAFHPEAGSQGGSAEVLADLERAAGAAPGHTRPLIARAQVLQSLGKVGEALSAARAAVTVAPDSPAVLLGATDAALATGEFSLAADWIRRARRAGASVEDAGLAAAQLAAARGDGAVAERELAAAMAAAEARQLVTRTPPGPLPEIYRRLAAIRREARDVTGAALLLRKAGNALYTRGEYGAALAAYREGLAVAPRDIRLAHNVGTALFALGRVGESITAFRRTLAASPDHAETWGSLGYALQAAQRPAEAAAAWRRALELSPARDDLRQALAALVSMPPR